MRPKSLLILSLAFGACSVFADPAVELAACINRGAERMRESALPRLQVECPVRENRTVTAALFPDRPFASTTDSQKISSLRALGLPADAIFYSGPDSPSVGHLVSLGPVYVYDSSYRDNRKYSTTSSLASYIRVARPMATTGNRFTIDLQRTDSGTVEIVGLQSAFPAVAETTDSRSLGYLIPEGGPTTEDWARADSTALRLSPDSFPQLPASVRDDLRRRGCTIPQSPDIPERHNVISGQFIRAGQTDWAVMCSISLVSRTLVYRAGTVAVIDTLGESRDADFLQTIGENRIGFSHRIGIATRQYIMDMAAAFDGPKPPPIDHDGIEDAFMGKASAIAYFHNGKWIGLQGAD